MHHLDPIVISGPNQARRWEKGLGGGGSGEMRCRQVGKESREGQRAGKQWEERGLREMVE